MANKLRLTPLLFLLIIVVYSLVALADIGGVRHNGGAVFSATARFECAFCHPKIASRDLWSVNSGGCLENYRCLSCHASVVTTTRSTIPHYKEIASSPHASVGCVYCHNIYHEGHESVSNSGAITYGCRFHNVAMAKWVYDVPANTRTFLRTYFVSSTSTKSPDLARNDYYYTTNLITRGTYVRNFVNPYLGRDGRYGATGRNLTCLHCHFTNVGPAAWGTTTSYIYRHPGECAQCHSRLVTASGGFTSAASAKAHTVDPAFRAYDVYCGRCHAIASHVAQSVHSRLGCRCHSVVHVSRYNSTASWIMMAASPPGVYSTFKSPALDWSQWRIILRYTPANNSAYCIWFRVEPPEGRYYPDIYGGTTPCIPVYAISVAGVLRYAGIAYAMRDGWVLANTTAYVFPGAKWLVCYNCHLIALPDGSVAGRSDGIRITFEALDMDPHGILSMSPSVAIQPEMPSSNLAIPELPLDSGSVTASIIIVAYCLAVLNIARRLRRCQ